jgi:signal transduction histidine kinase
MLKETDVLGSIFIYRQEVRPFSDKQIKLLSNFAAQAVIAIENARLLNELRESLDQQTATAEILGVVSRSLGDLAPVFESMLANAVQLCQARFGLLYLHEDGALSTVASHNVPPAFADSRKSGPIRPGPAGALGQAIRTKQTAHIADLAATPAYAERDPPAVSAVEVGGVRTVIAVPMLKDNEIIGIIVIFRQEVRPFTDKQVALLANFAAQAVIAIENARLLKELRQRTDDLTESLEQQTATSEVLHVISRSPGDLKPVFQTMLENATRICDAKFGVLQLYEGGGFRIGAIHNAPPAFAEAMARREPLMRPTPQHPFRRMVTTKEVVQIVDLTESPAYKERDYGVVMLVELANARTFLAVPMLKENEVVGVIAIYRQEVRAFTDKQVAVVVNFANQAVIAIENVRLLNELRERTDELGRSVEELRALGEVSQAVNSTLDVDTVLTTIIAKAVELSGTEAGTIYTFDEVRREFRSRASHGMDEAFIAAMRDQRIAAGETAVGRAAAERAPIQIPDVQIIYDEAIAHLPKDSSLVLDVVQRAGYRAFLIVPMLRPDQIVGALVVRRKEPGEFPRSTVELLETFADQSVLAIQNARLFREIEEKGRELEMASRHKSQFLANMSHELRTPLNAILGYTELIGDGIYGQPPEKMLGVLKRLESNGRHLLGLINDVLDLSKIEAGELKLSLTDYSITDMVATVLTSVEPLATAKKLVLRSELPADLPPARGDERRIAQVLLNLLGNAIKFTDSGEVSVRATAGNGSYAIAVRDTGPGISEADQAKLFQEFHQVDNSITRKKGGTGLGLAISKRIVEMHGGRIWLESSPGNGSTFSFTVPTKVEQQVGPS